MDPTAGSVPSMPGFRGVGRAPVGGRLPRSAGRSAAWLARLLWEQEVAGSNPAAPTMELRTLGRTGRQVSAVGLGAWQLGADWGAVDDDAALATLHAAVDAGVRFVDTADVYGDGRSERLIGRFLRERGDDDLVVATKAGRRADPHVAAAYTGEALRGWVARSLDNLGVDALDLVQMHCPPPEVYGRDAVFDALDGLVDDGLVRAYGISVETCDEALAAIARPRVATVQLILNVFRQKPLERVLPAALEAGVGIVVRVPLASGLLSGRYTRDTTFADDDHRSYNRDGSAFDIGETFAGVPFDVGVDAARRFATLAPDGISPAQLALRWILDQPGVSTVIPGARSPDQARANAAAADLDPLGEATSSALTALYDEAIRPHVHHRW
jgi:aryl-alcohol dehydrogenase-like predicted oxidoreductase